MFGGPWVSLFLGRLLGVYLDSYCSWGTRKDHIHMSIWDICLSSNAFRLVQCPSNISTLHVESFLWYVERFLEIFMDCFSIYGDSFTQCLHHLELVLQRCAKKNLTLNWEKCHFMIKHGIVLGHEISKKGIEVDRAKIELLSSPCPNTWRIFDPS